VAIGDPSRFWNAGEATAERLLEKMSLRPDHRVIEYGCGSLRVGAHFIRYLDRGNFLGLDVISGFYEMGTTMIGVEQISERAPQLHVIGEAALAVAEEFSADHIYSNLVCVHVHPAEASAHFGHLARLTRRAGSRLFFNAELADRPTRYDFNCWAWPMEFYVESLSGLELVRTNVKPARSKSGREIKPVEFEFRR
jgi:cyclopropane fatty-acyl-phospholipid synthase-like methyltransferase